MFIKLLMSNRLVLFFLLSDSIILPFLFTVTSFFGVLVRVCVRASAWVSLFIIQANGNIR